jgi:hypothetical protein
LGLQRTGAAVDILAVNLDRHARTVINLVRRHPAIGGAVLALVVMLVLGYVTRGQQPASYQALPLVEATSPATSLAPVDGAGATGTDAAPIGDPAASTRPATTTTTRPATTTTGPRPATTTTVRVHSAPTTTPTTRPSTTTTSTAPVDETDPVENTTTTTAPDTDPTTPATTADGEIDPEATTTTGPPPKLAVPGTPCDEVDEPAVDSAGTPLSCRPGITEPWYIWQ